MKNILIIAFWMLSLSVADAQVISNVTYDAKNKLINIEVINNFDKKVILSPINTGTNGEDAEACWYTVVWKDCDGKIVNRRLPDYIFPSPAGAYMLPKSSRTFTIDVKKDKEGIETIEFLLHIEVHVREMGKMPYSWEGEEKTYVFKY